MKYHKGLVFIALNMLLASSSIVSAEEYESMMTRMVKSVCCPSRSCCPTQPQQSLYTYGQPVQQAPVQPFPPVARPNGQCNPCYPSPGGPAQFCLRDASCNPQPENCRVVCGLQNLQTGNGNCDFTYQCGIYSSSSQLSAGVCTALTLAAIFAY